MVPAWTARDVGGVLANVDVRWQRAAFNGGLAAAVYPRTTRRNVIAAASFANVRSGKLTIRTLVNRKTVQIDGVSLVRG